METRQLPCTYLTTDSRHGYSHEPRAPPGPIRATSKSPEHTRHTRHRCTSKGSVAGAPWNCEPSGSPKQWHPVLIRGDLGIIVALRVNGSHTLRLGFSRAVDDSFHITDAATYELVVNFVVAPPPSDLPVSGLGGKTRTTLGLWPAIGGLLMLALGIGLSKVAQRAPQRWRIQDSGYGLWQTLRSAHSSSASGGSGPKLDHAGAGRSITCRVDAAPGLSTSMTC